MQDKTPVGGHIPSINVMDYFQCSSFTISDMNVFIHPGDQMVFECTLDKLMKQVR
jgi:hypothetical protein